MELAAAQDAYGAAYLRALLGPARAAACAAPPARLVLAGVPTQAEIDRALSTYEAFVWMPDAAPGPAAVRVGPGEGGQ
jgi:hypothetical protein